jgi:hypothetical protein
MKRAVAIAALLVLVAAGEPPAASDVVWKSITIPASDNNSVVDVYAVPAGRGFLLRDAKSNGSGFSIWRVRAGETERVADASGNPAKWESAVGIPFMPGDKVQLNVAPAGGRFTVGGVLTKP